MKTAKEFLEWQYGIKRDPSNDKGLIHFDMLLKAMEEYAQQFKEQKPTREKFKYHEIKEKALRATYKRYPFLTNDELSEIVFGIDYALGCVVEFIASELTEKGE